MIGIACLILLSSCAKEKGDSQSIVSSNTGGYYKVGKPYKIKGSWYYPQQNYTYDETGLASWYGQDFHDKLTANGEIFNKNELTAAHKTLPMPSLARVTNLENGRSIVVRINDRGPYVGSRIIDLSQRAAQLLGFEGQGVAKVRVQVLADESRAIAEAMNNYGTEPQIIQASTSKPLQPSVETYEDEVLINDPIQKAVDAAEVERPTLQTVKPVPRYVQTEVTGENNLYVQAGSFANKTNALRLQQKLSSLGDVNIFEADVKGAHYYRVRVGPIGSVKGADRMLDEVKREGISDARIIVAD
jgi:rare lipoprotein A